MILELAAVRFQVTELAIRRGTLELNLPRTDWGFMASAAGDCAMRSEQREFCLCVIKASYIRPGFGVVAGFAAEARAIGASAVHPILEFAMMRVGMACGTSHVVKFEWQDLVRAMRLADSVATSTRNGGVCAS